MEFIPNEKATVIRYPSTANLMIDSADRDGTTSPWNFQITKQSSILNGFFSRIGTTEVVLEWAKPNIQGDTLILDVSGATVRSNITIGDPLTESFATVEQILDLIPGTYNGVTFTITQTGSEVSITAAGGRFRVLASPLATKLGLLVGGALVTSAVVGLNKAPDLRLYRYIDFTSSQLTYNQEVKDASTAPLVRDVLCRWYMAYDEQTLLDAYGFPILMGYTPFVLRRLFNPPKQIKWSNAQPIGNLAFQVYGNDGVLLDGDSSQWLMTLQVSEV
jgi:hypothetical protein